MNILLDRMLEIKFYLTLLVTISFIYSMFVYGLFHVSMMKLRSFIPIINFIQ